MVSKPLLAIRCGSRAERDASDAKKQDDELSYIADVDCDRRGVRTGSSDCSVRMTDTARETAIDTPVRANGRRHRSSGQGGGNGSDGEYADTGKDAGVKNRAASRSKPRGGLLRRMKCGEHADYVDDSEVLPLDEDYYDDSRRGGKGTYLGDGTYRTAEISGDRTLGTSTIDTRDEITAARNRAVTKNGGYRPSSPFRISPKGSHLEPNRRGGAIGEGTQRQSLHSMSKDYIRGQDPLLNQRDLKSGKNAGGDHIINGMLMSDSIREIENMQVVYDKFVDDPMRGLNVRKFDYVPMPEGPTDVVIRVKASTVSYKDCIIRKGMWSEAIDLPAVPGFDCIGVVENIGDDVNSPQESGRIGESAAQREGLNIGDPVAALVQTGGNARYVTVDASRVFPVPGECDSAQAACVLSCYMTAYQALHRSRPRDKFDTLEGKKVLITGGIGPVGMAAIELALRAGAGTVYATVEDRYHSTLRARHPKGNVIPLPLHPKSWLPSVKGKMDCVVDGMCQDGYESPHAALNNTGVLICIGANTILSREGGPGVLGGPPVSVMWASAKAGYFMGSRTKTYEVHDSFRREPGRFRHDVAYLFGLLSRGKIKPSVAERIGLDEVPKMHRRMERGEICGGVVVVKPWQQRS